MVKQFVCPCKSEQQIRKYNQRNQNKDKIKIRRGLNLAPQSGQLEGQIIVSKKLPEIKPSINRGENL